MSTTALVTGATSGLGRATALALADRGWRVLAHGRDERRVEKVVRELSRSGHEARGYVADFSSLADVARMADDIGRDEPALDLLVNNAGAGAGAPGGRREVSTDGYELRLAVNFLAPVCLTERLEPLLLAVAPGPARVVNIGSVGQAPVDMTDPHLERSYDGMTAYVRSKFALAAYTFALAERHAARVHATCVHPATYMDTAMVRESGVTPWASVADGTRAVLSVVDQTIEITGAFFDGDRPARANPAAYDASTRSKVTDLATRLIDKTR